MQVTLKDGRVLSLLDDVRQPFVKEMGYFVLDSRPCDNPDLGVTPAIYVTCEDLQTVYSICQWEFVLGRVEDIEGD